MHRFMRTFWIGLPAAGVVTLLLWVTRAASKVLPVDPDNGVVIPFLALMVTVWILIVIGLRVGEISVERADLANVGRVLTSASGDPTWRIADKIDSELGKDRYKYSLLRGR